MGTGGGNVPIVIAIHEADGQDITMQDDVAYSLVTGGGKPGQGYPCVMVIEDEMHRNRFVESYDNRKSNDDID